MSRSVLVTGASSGFGRQAARALAEEGWRVFAAMRKPDSEARTETEADGSIEPIRLDVTDEAAVDHAVAGIADATGGTLDAVLNNAGYGLIGPFEELPDAECRRQMETNFFGTLAVTRRVLPIMRAAGRGRIAIVTSNAVNAPHPMLSLYAASKWALEGWAEGLAMEVAPFGIEVVVVQPGAHRTPFASNVVPSLGADSAYARWMEQAGASIGQLDRWGRDPERATRTLVDAVARPDMPFRTALGEDTAIFAALKGALPYEARASLLRALLNAPAPGSFAGAATEDGEGRLAEIARVVRERLQPGAIAELAAMLARGGGSVAAR